MNNTIMQDNGLTTSVRNDELHGVQKMIVAAID